MFDGGDAEAQGRKVFELRTYTSPEGKLNDLLARFRNDTLRIFEKHGMDNVGYWVPTDAPASTNTLIYILAHDSRDAATKSWAAFREDPEWIAVAEIGRRRTGRSPRTSSPSSSSRRTSRP